MPIVVNPFHAPKLMGINLSQVDATSLHELGQMAHDEAGNEYVYVFADTEAITANALVTISETGVATLADTAGNRVDGFAPVAIALDNYGWVATRGDFADVPVATGVAISEYLTYAAGASMRMTEVPAAYDAALPGVRGVVLSAPADNAATVRLF